jgi:hypothetical protein
MVLGTPFFIGGGPRVFGGVLKIDECECECECDLRACKTENSRASPNFKRAKTIQLKWYPLPPLRIKNQSDDENKGGGHAVEIPELLLAFPHSF